MCEKKFNIQVSKNDDEKFQFPFLEKKPTIFNLLFTFPGFG